MTFNTRFCIESHKKMIFVVNGREIEKNKINNLYLLMNPINIYNIVWPELLSRNTVCKNNFKKSKTEIETSISQTSV